MRIQPVLLPAVISDHQCLGGCPMRLLNGSSVAVRAIAAIVCGLITPVVFAAVVRPPTQSPVANGAYSVGGGRLTKEGEMDEIHWALLKRSGTCHWALLKGQGKNEGHS